MKENGLDIELRKRILQYLEAGHGYKKIATDFGISVYTAKYIRDIYRRGDLSYFGGVKTVKQYDNNEKLALVQQFLDSGLPLKTFAREEGINRNSLRNWVRKYSDGPQHHHDGIDKRARLNVRKKLALVQRFLDSGQPLKTFAELECINPNTFKSWVGKYHKGTLQNKKKTKRDDSEKLALVDAFLVSDQTLTAFAKSEGIDPSTFRNWVRKYQEGTLLKKS